LPRLRLHAGPGRVRVAGERCRVDRRGSEGRGQRVLRGQNIEGVCGHDHRRAPEAAADRMSETMVEDGLYAAVLGHEDDARTIADRRMNHQILFSARNQHIVDTGRRLIVQKIERRMFAECAYNEATDAFNEATEDGDPERIRLAKEVLTHKSDALSNAELFV